MENIIYSPSGHVSIRINADKMSAWMYVHKSDKLIDEREILDLIKDAGICYGFDEAQEWMGNNGYNKDFEKPFPVAICKSALNKEEVDFKFDPDNAYKPDSEWNIRDIQKWAWVTKGTPLAEVSLNLFGEGNSVYNIFGELTAGTVSTAFLADYLGTNASLDTENHCIVSAIDGYPYVSEDKKVNVTDHLIYNGDIKMFKMTSNVPVALTVNGSINKSHLCTDKDLVVKGNLMGSEINVDGNLTVEGSIIDCQTSGVVTTKDIKAKSISGSLVLCKGGVWFETTISNSRVIADRQIKGDPELSLIKGSHVLTAGNIDIADAGDEEGIETELESTTGPYNKERITQMAKLLINLKENAEVNKDKIELIYKKIVSIEEELSVELNTYLASSDPSFKCIKIRNELFKGVYIRVMKNSWQIKANQSNVEFTAE